MTTITVVVEGGVVIDLEGLPQGWDYQVRDYDNCPGCGRCPPLCHACLADAVEEEYPLVYAPRRR